jgi:hypothetical protein
VYPFLSRFHYPSLGSLTAAWPSHGNGAGAGHDAELEAAELGPGDRTVMKVSVTGRCTTWTCSGFPCASRWTARSSSARTGPRIATPSMPERLSSLRSRASGRLWLRCRSGRGQRSYPCPFHLRRPRRQEHRGAIETSRACAVAESPWFSNSLRATDGGQTTLNGWRARTSGAPFPGDRSVTPAMAGRSQQRVGEALELPPTGSTRSASTCCYQYERREKEGSIFMRKINTRS